MTLVSECNQVICGDFYEVLPKIRTKTVDMILTDLPYNTTQNKWDVELDLKEMWNLFRHILKESGIVCLTSAQPFTSNLVMSNFKEFKYEWIWQKEKGTGFLNAKKQPLRDHESILIFYNKQPIYNPQLIKRDNPVKHRMASKSSNYGDFKSNTQKIKEYTNTDFIYPKTVLYYSRDQQGRKSIHPTQKPVKLFEYLIKTYSNEGDVILDCCAGSGTTAIACMNTNRNYICIEKEPKYYEIIQKRIQEVLTQ